MNKFIGKIISFSLKNKAFIIVATLIVVGLGIRAFLNTPIEAFPDVINTRVVIITQWPGRSAEELEKFVTIPIETEMNVVPRKTSLRSISLYGLSVVTMIFDDGVEDFYARQMVSNQLRSVYLPDGAEPEVQPPSGPTGEIFRYTLDGKGKTVRELKEIQDWVIDKRLKAVPGVADVISFGGEVKTFEVTLDPNKLIAFNFTPEDIFASLHANNANVGGDVIEKSAQAYLVRGIGMVKNVQDIRNIIVKNINGTPIFIKDVADVQMSFRPRMGKVGRDGKLDVVEGIVLLRKGENPSQVLKDLNTRISDLNERILPEGVKINTFYDRTTLVNHTTHTVMENLIMGVLLVTFILSIFLADWRTTFIVAIIIPLALLFAFICMEIKGMSANLLSIGAIDFGIIVDGAVVMVEGIFVYLAHKQHEMGKERYNLISKMGLVKKVSIEMGKPIFFSKLIIITALIPIFAFQKVEGKMFSPLAYTIGFALLGALIFTLTLVPLLCNMLLSKNVREKDNPLVKFLENVYRPSLDWAMRKPKLSVGLSVGVLAISLIIAAGLGTEFLPQLNEGSIYVRASMPQSISFSKANALSEEMRQIFRPYPEVRGVISQNGRPNDGTDPTGFFNVEFFVDLLPKDEWERDVTKDELITDMQTKLEKRFPGVIFGFSQPISDNVQEAVSGVKGEMAIKVFGDDFTVLERKADSIRTIMSKIEGVKDLGIFKSLGQPELRIELDHIKMARYGANISDAEDIIEMAVGGKAASIMYEGERRFDIRVRFSPEYRNSEQEIGKLLIPCTNGTKIPLRELAQIKLTTGPAFVYREGNQRFVPIKFSVRERDLGGTIKEAQDKVSQAIKLDKGYDITWNGEFENQVRATNQLKIVVPISIALIFVWLFIMFNSAKDAGIVLMNVPFALIGGILGLYLTGINFSISAGVGFIALFGVCVQNGVILVAIFNKNREEGMDLLPAIREGALTRVRPVVMTALMAGLGLLPAALSTGIGSETQRPLAVVVIGGLISATILTLLILPVIYKAFYKNTAIKHKKKKSGSTDEVHPSIAL
ncbi:efflux RND transporter permease subunit [Rhodocytophaga rosea]|uniref:Efflux RND transporter permease subunit n=1 Tax=Rhodocytophaga rosea TaxID=2704465 RepID=A0A6C0GGR7_9BACT|nr:CusA/CzcA family heavy metal efflux RND transporter [Rhodocytophaga rosea]QHT66880.1 efflux RND transporter permease subunit [Rhodocytophaga rosea]